jgi:hypothetical protein
MKDAYQPSPKTGEIIYFTKARSALKYGLKILELKTNESILIPDFICESVISPILENSLQFATYKTAKDLSPLWSELESAINPNTKAILMVHYFGQPQDIPRFQQLTKKHNLFLIEDNAHGHAGIFENKILGTFGDIGISSPRKFEESGGVLYVNSNINSNEVFHPSLTLEKPEKNTLLSTSLLKKYPKLKHKLKLLFKQRLKYEDPRAFREAAEDDFYLSPGNIERLESINWKKTADLRRNKYLKLQSLAVKNGLQPLYKNISKDSNPWCFAAYVENHTDAIAWFDWGWQHNIEVFSWPTLREEQILDQGDAFQKWKTLICFSLS